MHTDHQATIDAVEAILEWKTISAANERLLDRLHRERLRQAVVKMRRKRAYVAVIGPQGCGKSTLLNALLFSRRILPEGEGVTTSIVCYIHGAEGTKERCEVRLLAGETIELPLSRASLEPYMDEAKNPQNTKRVASIHCFAESGLLASATSFVDTPGLGSLKTDHDRQTLSFVPDMSLGLFVLRTTPTLKRTEAEYLYNIWKYTPEFLFVQNVWGDSERDVAESVQENQRIISEVARRHGDTRPVTIFPLNIHAAAEEAANPQRPAEDRSPLRRLRELIGSRIARGGQAFEIAAQTGVIITCLESAIIGAGEERKAAALETQEEIDALNDELDEARNDIKDAEKLQAEFERHFRTNCTDLVASFQRELREGLRGTSAEYRAIVQNDGGRPGVEDAFLADVQRVVSFAHDAFQRQFSEVATNFIVLSANQLDRINTSISVSRRGGAASVKDVSDTRVSELVASTITILGQTTTMAFTILSAGTLATSIVGGSSILAAVAAGASFVPIVGWVAAGTVLGAGFLFRNSAREKRRTTLLSEFSSISDKAYHEASQGLSEAGAARCQAIATEVKTQVQAAAAQKRKGIADIEARLKSTDENKKQAEQDLKDMTDELQNAIHELRNLFGSL